MKILSILLVLGFTFVEAQRSNMNFNGITSIGSDSLVDVFPLAVGNQWIYSFSTTFYQESFPDYISKGTDTIQIIDKIIVTDTIKWLMHSTISMDTIELVEIQKGQHQLFISKNINSIVTTIFPFYPYVDTMVFRYDRVDTLGVRKYHSRNLFGKGFFYYTFKQGVGLLSVNFNDGCTCMDGFYGGRSLLGQSLTTVTNRQAQLRNYRLNQNYPNPFNPSTTISFSLSSRSFVSLKVFDLIGREVATMVSEEMQAGNYTRQWNASDLPSGIYFYRLQSGSFTETKKLILLK